RRRLGGPLPRQQADRPRGPPPAQPCGCFPHPGMPPNEDMRYYPAVGPAIPHRRSGSSRVTHPSATELELPPIPCDLHVLGTPPAPTPCHSASVTSTAPSSPCWAGPTPPLVNWKDSPASPQRPSAALSPIDVNNTGSPAPIPTGPTLISVWKTVLMSSLQIATRLPSTRPAPRPSDWFPVGNVAPVTTAIAALSPTPVRNFRA